MGKKIAIVIVVLVLIGGGAGGWFYYDSVLRFTDDYTDCPVKAFRGAVSGADQAAGWATEANLVSLGFTERCSLDCKHGNSMACVVYGLAQQQGTFLMKDEDEAVSTFNKACVRGEALACQLEELAKNLEAERLKAAAEAEARKANEQLLQQIARAKGEATKLKQAALAHFNGSEGPMRSGAMRKWSKGTVEYLLYGKPLLSKKHRLPGKKVEGKPGLKEFVLGKYTGGEQRPDYDLIKELFDELKRKGVMQIRLDYYVEKKKESDIPRTHGYFRAKHTFLHHVADVELEVLKVLEETI